MHAGLDQRALLFGVVHNHGLAGANQIVNGHGVLFDQHIRPGRFTKVIHKVAAQVAPADDDYVILHFTGEHAASLLRVVTLHRLQNKNGNDNSEQNALAPKGIENPQRTRLDAKIDGVQEGFQQR